ncbi:hypothetical protein [Leptothoe spongobia]|uniref:Uncharacterized protein n=1 Tax=Leptothoe spongobia TAU-MAC 1115 TaxID=1967444 RepID=A0A947DBD8_9CYAN|nr:hypothetical protein [Leptothoe spongobia]MBT9314063.1 hypothetical protein [Leptothoe spongobia TAU-MAC 1115]
MMSAPLAAAHGFMMSIINGRKNPEKFRFIQVKVQVYSGVVKISDCRHSDGLT